MTIQAQRKISPPLADIGMLRTPLERGEQAVLDFFNRTLPPAWEIYVQPHLNGLRPDFVLLNPKIGIAVFEVKNWNLSAMRYWVETPNDEKSKPRLMADDGTKCFALGGNDPVVRIRFYKAMIEELFCPRMATTAAKALITAGIIFTSTDTSAVECLLHPLLESYKMRGEKASRYYPVAGADALTAGDLSRVFPEALRRSSCVMRAEYAEDLRDWLEEPSLAKDQRTPLADIVDSRQRDLIVSRPQSGYRRIRGPAGSGKSLVLGGRAGQLVSEGKDVLVVSYNITLLHYLQDLAVRWSDKSRVARKAATWWNFHLWCRHVSFEAGMGDEYGALWGEFRRRTAGMEEKRRDQALDQFLSVELPSFIETVLNRASNGSVATYDAILVDEGQDFRPEWWNLLRRVVRSNGEMLLVADATQDLYQTAKRWTDESMRGLDTGFRGPWTSLEVSYRLPIPFLPLVREYAREYLPNELRHLPSPKPDPQGILAGLFCNPRWVQVTGDDPISICAEEVIRLLKRHASGSLSVADVVFLSQRISEGEAVVTLLKDKYRYCFAHTFSSDKEEGRRLKHAFFLGDARMKATTIHSFKGYETRALVVFIDDNPVQPGRELLYVALTRLREDQAGSYITVVSAHPELAEYGRSWPEYEEM